MIFQIQSKIWHDIDESLLDYINTTFTQEILIEEKNVSIELARYIS